MNRLIVAGFALYLAILFGGTAGQTAIRFLPTLYVTNQVERPKADQSFMYQATICDPELYDGNLTLVHVNIPHGWNPVIGSVAKIEACVTEKCTAVHCTNWPNGKFNGNHYCNFTYNASSMTDLLFRITAGRSSSIDWTVGVDFLSAKEWYPPPPVHRGEAMGIPEPMGLGGNGTDDIIFLGQIVKSSSPQTVLTLGIKEFSFHFCPDKQTGDRYDVTISVTATDSVSGMSTFVCLPNELPCTVTSSTHYDPRGIGINTVTLTTGSASLTKLYVLVVGWGDSGQSNTFLIGATLKKMS